MDRGACEILAVLLAPYKVAYTAEASLPSAASRFHQKTRFFPIPRRYCSAAHAAANPPFSPVFSPTFL